MWHVGSYFPDQGSNRHPLQWKRGVLTTGPPGNSPGMPFFFFLINLFIYLFMAALGLNCCALAFSSCGERGLLFVVVCRLRITVASLVVEHGL